MHIPCEIPLATGWGRLFHFSWLLLVYMLPFLGTKKKKLCRVEVMAENGKGTHLPPWKNAIQSNINVLCSVPLFFCSTVFWSQQFSEVAEAQQSLNTEQNKHRAKDKRLEELIMPLGCSLEKDKRSQDMLRYSLHVEVRLGKQYFDMSAMQINSNKHGGWFNRSYFVFPHLTGSYTI